MKCFIHGGREAVATCRQCGKGMCSDCSAYTGHKGICPACMLDDYKEELMRNEDEYRSCGWAIVGWSFVCLTVIGILFGVPKIICRSLDRKKLKKRNDFLVGEIRKLEKALRQGGMGL